MVIFFQAEVKLEQPFTPSLNDSYSPEFKNLSQTIKDILLPPMKKIIPQVADLNVTGFKPGSVIAEFDIIMIPNAVFVTEPKIAEAIETILSNDNVTAVKVNTTFTPVVRG